MSGYSPQDNTPEDIDRTQLGPMARVENLEAAIARGVDTRPSHPLDKVTEERFVAVIRWAQARMNAEASLWSKIWPFLLAFVSGTASYILGALTGYHPKGPQ